MEMIKVSFDGALRKKVPYTVAFIDLDDFKQINDRYGHDYGDRILGEVGENLIARFRRSDLVVRWGGEELSGRRHPTRKPAGAPCSANVQSVDRTLN